MTTYNEKNASLLKKRVKKAHSKSKFIGTLYLFGTLLMLAIACLPSFEVDGKRLWVLEAWKPIKNLFSASTRNYFEAVVAILYFFVVISALFNFFKCFPKLSWLSKRSLKYAKGYNKNMNAMNQLGKLFSGSLGAYVIFHFLIYMILPVGSVRLTLVAYAGLGVGLFFHFICGLPSGKVSYFREKGNVGEIEEEKRPCRLFVYFFRNVVQLVATTAIIYYFVKNCNFNDVVTTALSFKNPLPSGMLNGLVPFALKVVILICLLVLIKHATASTEFNRKGIKGVGMKNFRVFSFFIALASGGIFALDYFVLKTEPKSYAYAIIAGIAFVAFLIDCIFKSKPKYVEEETVEEKAVEPVKEVQPTHHTANICQQAPVQPAQPSQPVYVPVYYAYPAYPPVQQQPAPTPFSSPLEVKLITPSMPTPAPTPVEVKVVAPTMSSIVEPTQTEDKAISEGLEKLNPNKTWNVRCPECGKQLTVRETSPYHRCPACDKIFKLQKFRVFEPKN